MTRTRSRWWRPRSLQARFALWISLATGLSLAVFAVVAFLVAVAEEREEVASGAVEETDADIRNEILTAMAFAAPVGLLLATGGALWLARRALAPVDRVIRTASEITAERLDRRIEVPEREDELRELAMALNALLARLERGYQGLSLFAADVSHELRTPLAVIGNELEVALRRPRTAGEWEAAARSSLDELRRLGRLVAALLDLTRGDATAPSRSERLELAALVDEALAGQGAAAGRAEVALVNLAGRTRAEVDGIPAALASAVSNLVANAIRYSPPGGRVAVSVDDGSGGSCVALHIDDSGPGLDPGEVERIFAPFARGTQGRAADLRDGGAGLGLGLAIARRIVERHGGRLVASNRPAGGARFTIELPGASESPR